MGLDGGAFSHRRTNDGDIADDGRRGVDADLAGLKIDLLVRALDDADLQVDDAVGAEGRNHRSGLGVQRDETIAVVT